jgi:hypothetical protein
MANCLHDDVDCKVEPRLRIIKGGGKTVYKQCLKCGGFTGNALPMTLHPNALDAIKLSEDPEMFLNT